MVSGNALQRAYVYAQTAGEPAPVGIIGVVSDGFEFVYAKSWLAREDSFAVDPIHLPLRSAPFKAPGMFSVFLDSLPDDWGRRVVAAIHRQQPRNEIEWLLASRGTGVGCLLYSGSRDGVKAPADVPDLSDLRQIASAVSVVQARQLVEDEALIKLLWHGSSMGGARPKATVRFDDGEWIAKLARESDLFDNAKAEKAFQRMAEDIGLPVVESVIVPLDDTSVFLVKRFDRTSDMRHHYLSARSLLSATRISDMPTMRNFTYVGFADALKRTAMHAAAACEQVFTRMVFNVAISNTDDHLLNHGVLYLGDEGYDLSPVFDVLPNPRQPLHHALGIGAEGRIGTLPNVLSRHAAFGLSYSDAHDIVERVFAVVAQHRLYFDAVEMAAVDQAVLSPMCKAMEPTRTLVAGATFAEPNNDIGLPESTDPGVSAAAQSDATESPAYP